MTKRMHLKYFLSLILVAAPLVLSAQEPTTDDKNEALAQKQRIAARAKKTELLKGVLIADRRKRTYYVHVPPQYDPQKPTPLVIVLHGGGRKALGAVRISEMNLKADEKGFIALYPNGTGKLMSSLLTWNSGNCCGYAMRHDIDDVAFMRQLLKELPKEYSIDPNRIYIAGFSNGAMMAYKLAHELSGYIAAIAPVAGSMQYEPETAPVAPVSIIAFHGTADEYTPYYGGEVKNPRAPRVDKPVADAISFWVKHNECSEPPIREESETIIKETYTNGKKGTEVVLYTIKDGGHAWPGGKKGNFYGNIDPPTQEISATDLMWDFFQRHPKEQIEATFTTTNPPQNSP